MNDTRLSAQELVQIARRTCGHYDANAPEFWTGTRDHDVEQNIEALLMSIEGEAPFRVLDLGCGPGRDLIRLTELGHRAVGLDGSSAFVDMARRNSGCEVLHQDFLAMDLPDASFDGVFANASLFHVPEQEVGRVLEQLHATLRPSGVLFTSNPRGDNQAGWSGDRYSVFYDLERWTEHVSGAGFAEVRHYYRPTGKPREQQPWLASVWRKSGAA